MPINKPSQPLIPPTDVEEVEEIAASAAEAAIAADDTHAPLVDNLVPAENLPSYVDDVLEFAALESFPTEGEPGKIYVALDTNNTYRWSGSAYVQVGGSEIDLTPYALKTEVAAAVAPKADAADLAALSGEVALKADAADLTTGLATKQDTLVSGTNIKTINGESVLGSGNIEIQGGDPKNHALMINATFENSSFTVTSFQCDDLEPNVWFTNEPTTILLGLIVTSGKNEWFVEAPIACYHVDLGLYTSAVWQIAYAKKTAIVSLQFMANGCNFIDHKGNIVFTLSGLEAPQYNLYVKTPDTVMPIPAENGSFDPSTLTTFTINPAAGSDRLYGDKTIFSQEDAYYPGYGPMVPNVVFQFKGENQFGTLISKTEDSHQNPVITVRLLDDQFNPLDATMVITSISQEQPGDVELRYVINTKQVWCTRYTNYDWLINTDYVIDGWLVFTEPSE